MIGGRRLCKHWKHQYLTQLSVTKAATRQEIGAQDIGIEEATRPVKCDRIHERDQAGERVIEYSSVRVHGSVGECEGRYQKLLSRTDAGKCDRPVPQKRIVTDIHPKEAANRSLWNRSHSAKKHTGSVGSVPAHGVGCQH